MHVLIRVMITPIVATDREMEASVAVGRAPLQLRSPRQTARMFFDRATRVGKDLVEHEPSNLDELDSDDAQLGKLLRLLAVSAGLSLHERSRLRPEWLALLDQRADFGAVITPMAVSARGVEARSEFDPGNDYAVTANLTRRLESELEAQDRALTKSLDTWTRSLVREGAKRLLSFTTMNDR